MYLNQIDTLYKSQYLVHKKKERERVKIEKERERKRERKKKRKKEKVREQERERKRHPKSTFDSIILPQPNETIQG